MIRIIFFILSIITYSKVLSQNNEFKWGMWNKWGEQEDGTYINPIIPSDYSDIDCIKVGKDYYAITSTFQLSPGMTVMHSEDLVNWELCGHAVEDITQISPELNWDKMNRYGRGIWAGSIRYHNDKFYVVFGTPDEGYFITSATSPYGPWEPLTQLLNAKGWDDCSIIWDSNGKACFVGTNFSDNYKTYLFEMGEDLKSIKFESAKLVNSGNGREANKLIKVGKWYYLIFSKYKPEKGRYVMAKRSLNMMGPYIEEKQLALPSRDCYEPNQGGIIEGENNKWYFFTHHGKGDWSGRVASLLPVTWINDWPLIGEIIGDSIGKMSWKGDMPFKNKKKYKILRSDDFNNNNLGPQWQWNYHPRVDKFSLTERKGWLRMKAYKPIKQNNILYAGNTITQRTYRSKANDVIIKMDISSMANGQKCGLCHFSIDYASIGIIRESNTSYIEYKSNNKSNKIKEVKNKYIWFKSSWDLNGIANFSYSLDGINYNKIELNYQLKWGKYRGNRIGIYCYNDISENGYVDIDYFNYKIIK